MIQLGFPILVIYILINKHLCIKILLLIKTAKIITVLSFIRCENLADLIWQNRQQITEVDLLRAQLPIDLPAGRQDLVPVLRDTITRLLSSLVTRFVA